MVYKAIGLMSGSSLDGLDVVFAHYHDQAGQWNVEIKASSCYDYSPEWKKRLQYATQLSARDYCLLHAAYGHFLGECVNRFIEEKNIYLQADLIASHGHTVFHSPGQGMTAQLGDGASIAAEAGMAVISDLRSIDVALGGEGAPIVPLGEQLLFPEYEIFLNIGGIANISCHKENRVIAFDVCPANRVLNELSAMMNKPFDENGMLAKAGVINKELLHELNTLDYYSRKYPKSLSNDFGIGIILPIINKYSIPVQDKLRTYTEHVAVQIRYSLERLMPYGWHAQKQHDKLLATGGGSFNGFLIGSMQQQLEPLGIEVIVPDEQIVKYKEALIIGLLGVLRWRENKTSLASVTGARRDSIGGALWMGQDP
jgi:anhydro-N-acetylmuramic acid kinase